MDELTEARKERDESFEVFMTESAKATKHTLKAQAARKRYMLARDAVRGLEFDLLAFPIQN
jgi:hypothetical protein